MQNLIVHNQNFITYTDTLFTIDVLGGVDLQQIEKMICTLRITHKNFPPMRTTLDLYIDSQTDKLIRTLCDKYGVTLLEVSKTTHEFIRQLESYKLERLRYPKAEKEFEMSEEEESEAVKYLKNKNLISNLQADLQKIGILGEAENALILFLAMASHASDNPFSVLCLAKSGIGKSYLLQKLSACMPKNTFSFHTQISENALYYFDSRQIDGKVLFIEDLEWTNAMLNPLATLQTQGKLIKTRATKDKDGMLHSTTFEVAAKLCLIACAYSEKNYESLSLPFLCLHLNHSHLQDINVMEYQKKCKAGLINQLKINQIQRKLQCVLASLKTANIINPYAMLINLPDDLPHPRKTLLLLLNFIETITFFNQFQRETATDTSTGEIFIKTAPADIELAFNLLKNSLFRRADELSTNARGFYVWLQEFLKKAETQQFTALDIRKSKRLHPRTLNRYLQELVLFNYIQIAGGNKYREGYRYKITDFDTENGFNTGIENALKKTIETIKAKHEKTEIKTLPETETEQPDTPEQENESSEQPTQPAKRLRINDKENYTFKILAEQEQGQEFTIEDVTALTKRSQAIEMHYLNTLCKQGKLNKERKGKHFYYTLATSSKTDGQSLLSNLQNVDNQIEISKTTQITENV
jgi:hypothetical protein